MSYSKGKYKDYAQSWGDFEREYYQLLNAVDNLKEIICRKYQNFSKAERELGYHRAELRLRFDYHLIPPNLKGLKRLCKLLDISFHYAIFGGREEPYSVTDFTFKNFKKIYDEKYEGRKNPIVSELLRQVNKGRITAIPLKYLIRVAREQHVTIDWLIGG